jgi:quercetin dioxygenase-like cupin family protein
VPTRRYGRLQLLALVLTGVLTGAVVVRGQEEAVPVYHEPHHRMVLESSSVRILDVQVRPGQTSYFHTHDGPILYVQLSSSPLRVEALGEDPPARPAGRPAAAPRQPPPGGSAEAPTSGRVSSTTSYVERPVTHRITNTGDGLFRLIAVLARLPGDESTTAEAAGFTLTPELTNRWYRAYRFSLAPAETTTKHRHTAPAVVVQVTPGRAAGAGATRYELTDVGRWAYFEAGEDHELANTGEAAVEFVEVEVRQGDR